MRRIIVLAVIIAGMLLPGAAAAQTYDQAAVEAHLREMYRHHGDRLFKWKRPVHYLVLGLESEATQQLIDTHFAYLRDLTGLDIQRADRAEQNGNFILVFADPLSSIADLKTLRPLFGSEGQSDADYRSMLEGLDRDAAARTITKRTEDAIAQYALLINPGAWKEEVVSDALLTYIVIGLTQTVSSDEISPSIWNAGYGAHPISRLPSIDELYLKNLYRGGPQSGVPIELGIRHLAAAIAFDLNS